MPKNAHWRSYNVPKRRTVKVVCVNCVKTSYITLFGLPNEYRGLVALEKCVHCGVTGKLATSDLAKTRPKHDGTKQLKLNWGKR